MCTLPSSFALQFFKSTGFHEMYKYYRYIELLFMIKMWMSIFHCYTLILNTPDIQCLC